MLINLERLIQRIEAEPEVGNSLTFTPSALYVHSKAVTHEVIQAVADDAWIAAQQDWNLWGFRKALLALLERSEVVRGQRSQWK